MEVYGGHREGTYYIANYAALHGHYHKKRILLKSGISYEFEAKTPEQALKIAEKHRKKLIKERAPNIIEYLKLEGVKPAQKRKAFAYDNNNVTLDSLLLVNCKNILSKKK